MRKKLVYIAGPYSADTPHGIYANIELARKYAEKYLKLGYAVICPHLNTAFMDGVISYEDFLAMDLEIIRRCDTVVAMPNWKSSKGAIGEIAFAKEQHIEIIYE